MILFLNFFKKKEKGNVKTSTSIIRPKERIHNEKIANRKGELGEYKIDIQLDQLPKEYKHLSDLLVLNPKAKSGYSQIDHVVITPYGIFVIETKNYQGTIYGGKDRKTWSVNGKFNLMNPFTQNYGHIQALKNSIDKKYHDFFISMVSFTKRCTFKLDEIEVRKIASNELIVYDVELSDYINRKVSVIKLQHKEILLNEDDINHIYTAIVEANIEDQANREQHVQSLKEGKSISKETATKGIGKCNICDKSVSEKVIVFCQSNKQFNGKIYCYEHQNVRGR